MGTNLPQDLSISLLGIYPKDTPAYHNDTYSTMFIAAFFIVARNWKQLRYALTKDWKKKMWYIYTMEYYSVINSYIRARQWWHTPLTPALGRQRQPNLC